MKHKVLAFILAAAGLLAVCLTGFASTIGDGTSKITKKEVKALLKEFKKNKGYECEEVGSFGLALMKAVADSDDEDDADGRLVLKSIDKLKGIIAADLSDCNLDVIFRFNARVEELLKDAPLLIEAKDEDESIKIYGTVSPNGKHVSDVIIFCPEDAELTYFEGIIDIGALRQYANEKEAGK